jgi:membrane associated rhomboid family serine protease
MAQTRKRRRRKHRGTQTGRVDNRARGRPRNRAEARSQARSRSPKGQDRRDRRPTWRSAFLRGLLAAGIFFALMMVVFGESVVRSAALGGFMLAFYVPFGYYFDMFFYRRRKRQQQRAREEKQAG